MADPSGADLPAVADHVVVHGFRFGPGDYLSPRYAADLAGISTSYLMDQRIPSVRNHRNSRQYLVADVLAWCERRDAAVEAQYAARRKDAS